MKKTLLALLLFIYLAAILCACKNERLTYPDTTTDVARETDNILSPVAIEAYASAGADELKDAYEAEVHYGNAASGMLFSNGETVVFMYLNYYSGLPEGSQFVYLNKLSGTTELTPLCKDPLCDHGINSDCAFYNSNLLMYYGGRVFCYKGDPRTYDAAIGTYGASVIFSVDLKGGDYKEHTTFFGEVYGGICQGYGGKLYLLSPNEDYEKYFIISIDMTTGKCEKLSIDADDGILSFFISEDTIYVVFSENGLYAYNLNGTLKEKLSDEIFSVCYKYENWLYSGDRRFSLIDHTIEPLKYNASGFYGDHYWFWDFFYYTIYRVSLTDSDKEAELICDRLPEDTTRINSIAEIDGLLYISYTTPSEYKGKSSKIRAFTLYDPEREKLYTLFSGN